MLTNLLIIDIETVPQQPTFQNLNKYWQELWWEKVQKTVAPDVTPEESYHQKAGILAEFGKIVCISTAFFYQQNGQWTLKIKSIYGDDEAEILNNFIALCQKVQQLHPQFQFAGHNIKEFDIPFICRRLMIQQIPLPDFLQFHDKKPWETKMFDTLHWWKFGDHKNYVSLHLLASVLNIPTSKDDIDGSMVQVVYHQEKNLDRIVAYCQKDVVVTANIILRFHHLPLLEASQIRIV